MGTYTQPCHVSCNVFNCTNTYWGSILTSATLDVEGRAAESTALKSSTDKLVEASVLLELLKLEESIICFLEGSLLLLPDVNNCPLLFLGSVPNNSCHNYWISDTNHKCIYRDIRTTHKFNLNKRKNIIETKPTKKCHKGVHKPRMKGEHRKQQRN